MPGEYEKWYGHDKPLAMNFMVVYSLHALDTFSGSQTGGVDE